MSNVRAANVWAVKMQVRNMWAAKMQVRNVRPKKIQVRNMRPKQMRAANMRIQKLPAGNIPKVLAEGILNTNGLTEVWYCGLRLEQIVWHYLNNLRTQELVRRTTYADFCVRTNN